MNKGDREYFKHIKKKEQIKCIIQFLIVILFLVTGYIATQTKLNLFTLVAVLSCLPASKTLVGVIVKWPIHSIAQPNAAKIEEHSEHVTIIYNPILTSKEQIMPLDCIAISDNKIFGYTTSTKASIDDVTKYLRHILEQNHYTNINIKLFQDFSPFMSRVEGLNNIGIIDGSNSTDKEAEIKHSILLYCM